MLYEVHSNPHRGNFYNKFNLQTKSYDLSDAPTSTESVVLFQETCGVRYKVKFIHNSNSKLIHQQGLYFGNNPELTDAEIKTILEIFG